MNTMNAPINNDWLEAEAEPQDSAKALKIERETHKLEKRLCRQVGQANAAFAGAGVKVGEGSAREVERQINQDVEHDAFQTILEGDRRSLGLKTQATMARIDGSMKQTAGYVNAAGSLLATGYQAYTKWKTMPSTGDGLSQGDRRKIGVF